MPLVTEDHLPDGCTKIFCWKCGATEVFPTKEKVIHICRPQEPLNGLPNIPG